MAQNPNLALGRLALAGFLTTSFLFAGYTISCRSTSARMTLGNAGTDHLSHANAAVLFFYRGCEIYRVPVDELLERDPAPGAAPHSAGEDWLTQELFRLPERKKSEVPLWLNWPQLARVYPPGLYLYTLPEAVGLEYTDLPLGAISAFSLLKYTLVAHLFLWLFCDWLLVSYSWTGRLGGVLPAYGLLLMLILAVQVQVCFWTLSGFYDGLALLFLVLLVVAYKRQLWSQAIFFFAVAVFCHFRSLWFLPLAGLAALHLARLGVGKVLASRRDCILLLGSTLLLAVSGFFFVLAYPSLTKFPLVNPLYFKTLKLQDLSWVQWALFAVLISVPLLRRDWLLLVNVAGVLVFLCSTRQMQHWHSLSLVPLVLCSRQNSLPGLFSGAMTYGILSYLFMQVCPFDPVWAHLYYFGP